MSQLLWCGVLLALACAACGRADAGPSGSRSTAAPPKTQAELYFPLEDGKIYNYATLDGGETGMLVARVHRTGKTSGELRLSNATKRFTLTDDGVSYEGGAFLLRAPLAIGSSWSGEHGGTTKITEVDASVDVPAGRFTGCLRTVEVGGRPTGARYESTYCPGVGMVRLVVSAPGTEARAELRSYGMPVKIE